MPSPPPPSQKSNGLSLTMPRPIKWSAISTKSLYCICTVYACMNDVHVNAFFMFFIYNRQTEGYSGSDLTALARDAALGPIRGRP